MPLNSSHVNEHIFLRFTHIFQIKENMVHDKFNLTKNTIMQNIIKFRNSQNIIFSLGEGASVCIYAKESV